MLKVRAAMCRDLNVLRKGTAVERRNSEADVVLHPEQEPVQTVGQSLRQQICRGGHVRPHGHKLNVSQQCAL